MNATVGVQSDWGAVELTLGRTVHGDRECGVQRTHAPSDDQVPQWHVWALSEIMKGKIRRVDDGLEVDVDDSLIQLGR